MLWIQILRYLGSTVIEEPKNNFILLQGMYTIIAKAEEVSHTMKNVQYHAERMYPFFKLYI